MINGEYISAFVCAVIVDMDRRCSQSVRTLVFDDSDSEPPKAGQKDLSSAGAPSSLNQSAEGLYRYLLIYFDVVSARARFRIVFKVYLFSCQFNCEGVNERPPPIGRARQNIMLLISTILYHI